MYNVDIFSVSLYFYSVFSDLRFQSVFIFTCLTIRLLFIALFMYISFNFTNIIQENHPINIISLTMILSETVLPTVYLTSFWLTNSGGQNMKDNKTFSILQRIGRSFMLPIAILPVAGLFLGIGGSFTNTTMIEAYNLTRILGEGTLLHSFLTVLMTNT